MTTIDNDQIDLGDAEEFRLPSDGNHTAYLQRVELAETKKGGHEQFTLFMSISPEDSDSPNFPLRYFVMWPNPDDKDVMWGTRTAYGSMVQKIKDMMTAFGGQESGGLSKKSIALFLDGKEGQAVKVKTKQSFIKDEDTGQPTDRKSVNIEAIMPA